MTHGDMGMERGGEMRKTNMIHCCATNLLIPQLSPEQSLKTDHAKRLKSKLWFEKSSITIEY